VNVGVEPCGVGGECINWERGRAYFGCGIHNGVWGWMRVLLAEKKLGMYVAVHTRHSLEWSTSLSWKERKEKPELTCDVLLYVQERLLL
jgi:hypothetical protein